MKVRRFQLNALVLAVHASHRDWNSVQIGKTLNCHPSYVRETLRRHGLKLTGTRMRKQLQPWERQSILDAYKDGEKLEAIAAEFGVTVCCVNMIRVRAGCKPRTQRIAT